MRAAAVPFHKCGPGGQIQWLQQLMVILLLGTGALAVVTAAGIGTSSSMATTATNGGSGGGGGVEKTTHNNNSNNNKFLTLPLQRRTASIGEPQQVDALYQDYGEHYVDLWCGTPTPQRQTLLVVTGVSPGASGFPCSTCGLDCIGDHVDHLYDESQSSSFKQLTCNECLNGNCVTGGNVCQVGMSYPEGSSWRGYEVVDKCYMGGPHDHPLYTNNNNNDKLLPTYNDMNPHKAPLYAFDFIFGCQTQITGSFLWHLADGILSMDNTPGSFWYQMYTAGKIPQKKFTMCYRKALLTVDDSEANGSTGTHAGAMTLGGVDIRLHKSDMVMSVLDTSTPSYKVQLRKIHLRAGGGGESAKSTNKALPIKTLPLDSATLVGGKDHPILLDSGYTLTVLTREIMVPFYDAWKELTGSTYTNYPKSMSLTERDALPTILLQLVGDEEYNGIIQKKNMGGSRESGGGRGWPAGLAGDELDPDYPLDVIVAVPPSHYMELVDDGTGSGSGGSTSPSPSRFKAGFVEASDRENGKNVLGANIMRGHDILFDVEDQRLGWAESSCNYTEMINQYNDDNDTKNIVSPTDDRTIVVPPVPSPSSSASSTTASTEKRGGGICSSGMCRGSISFLVMFGIVATIVIQVKKSKRGGQINYQDVPTEFELTDHRDNTGDHLYRPPPTAA